MLKSIDWNKARPKILDQLKLPHKVAYLISKNYKDTAEAIRSMKIRGAPALAVAAAFAMAQQALASKAKKHDGFLEDLEKAGDFLKATRPTAVNLAWGVERMLRAFEKNKDHKIPELKSDLVAEALEIAREDAELCTAIGKHGAELIRDGDKVLTHCNTGALATAGIGTALGVITTAFGAGKKISVWVDETRPYLQGARLTAFELGQAGLPHTLVTDNSAALLMSKGLVNSVIVGADRITAQGDVANKIGTYGVAILAKEHGIPFYVAAPLSTFDLKLEKGVEIPIEERPAGEVLMVNGKPIAPKGTKAAHYGFDVTPHKYISGIVTEAGILRAPYREKIARAVKEFRTSASFSR
jgi:methylthioribose-1-phosphate isomerase